MIELNRQLTQAQEDLGYPEGSSIELIGVWALKKSTRINVIKDIIRLIERGE
jgi:hypothetical protein